MEVFHLLFVKYLRNDLKIADKLSLDSNSFSFTRVYNVLSAYSDLNTGSVVALGSFIKRPLCLV